MHIGEPAARHDLIDGLRGVALLGILWINLSGHAFPFYALWDPTIAGGDDAINLGAWAFSEVFVEGAMRGLFSLLFGASILLFMRGAEGDAAPIRRADLYFRRNWWLVAFGLVHGFLLLMPGDILYTYGLCGLFLFLFRNSSVMALASIAVVILTIIVIGVWQNASGDAVSPPESSDFAEKISALSEAARAGYAKLLPIYAADYAYVIFSSTFVDQLLDALVMMLAGMALLRSGLLLGDLGAHNSLLVGGGLALVAIALRAYATQAAFADHFAEDVNPPAAIASEIGRVTLAIGYALLFVGFWKAGALRFAEAGLSAAGRMAFTHYLGGTLIATTLFYGHGFGLYGALQRHQVYALAIGIWLLQIAFSLLWLHRFRFGPFEWLWRSLTRLELQQLRR